MSTSNMRVSKGAYVKDSFSTLFKVFGYILFGVLALYILFSMFLMRVLPSPDLGATPIKNITFDGGIVPVGENVIVNLEGEVDDSILGSLKQAFVPQSGDAEVVVLTKPYGEITRAEDGSVSVDGEKIGVIELDSEKEYLEDKYLAECLAGACNAGDIVLVDKNSVYGERL